MSTQTFAQSRGIFADDPTYGSATLLPVQTTISSPNLDALDTASSPLAPDYHSDRRLDHFPDEIYDLRPTSHLMRFLKALLGDAGAGQLRKRYLVARLQQDMRTSHFFDLDSFYGALFGAVRHADETLPADPMVSTAPSASWDTVTKQDTSYRERLYRLASAIPMGGTIPGLRTAASAIFDCDVEIYEIWSLLDEGFVASGSTAHTWDDIQQTYPTWTAMEGQTWNQLSGTVALGASITNNRSEFIVQPRKQWTTDQQRAAEEYDAKRVLSHLKPAGTLLTISPEGIPVHEPAHIAGFAASSEYWEVQATVTPTQALSQPGNLYGPGELHPIIKTNGSFVAPRPPFSAKQGERISYNADIVSVQAYEQNKQATVVTDVTDYETVTYGKVRVAYSGDKAVMTPRQVAAAHYISDGTLVANPYSQPRPVAVSH